MTSTDTSFLQPAAGGGESPALYPVALKLWGRPCLVVGGGPVAARKVRSLLEAGAQVTVVSPNLCAELARGRADAWNWTPRHYAAGDAAGCLLVVVATDDPRVNREAAEDARAAGALVNVADDPEACDFFVPAVVRRGPLQVAVSTSGLAPGLAAALRRRFEALLPDDLGRAVALLGEARLRARERGLDESKRRRLARELAGLDLERLLAEGGLSRVESAVTSCISRYWA